MELSSVDLYHEVILHARIIETLHLVLFLFVAQRTFVTLLDVAGRIPKTDNRDPETKKLIENKQAFLGGSIVLAFAALALWLGFGIVPDLVSVWVTPDLYFHQNSPLLLE